MGAISCLPAGSCHFVLSLAMARVEGMLYIALVFVINLALLSFYLHGNIRASSALLIWLNDKVKIIAHGLCLPVVNRVDGHETYGETECLGVYLHQPAGEVSYAETLKMGCQRVLIIVCPSDFLVYPDEKSQGGIVVLAYPLVYDIVFQDL